MIAKNVNDTKILAQKAIDNWKPIDPSWKTVNGCAYLRLSTDKQVLVEKGSLEQQVHIATSEAEIKSRESHINYRIVRFFIEAGFSGKNNQRPEFLKMNDEIKGRLYRFIVVKELSRITRDELTWHSFIQNCVDSDCEFITRGIRLNPRDPIQKYFLNNQAGTASLESSINSKRQMESNHTRLTISKRFNSTHPILGLDQKMENGRLVKGEYQNNAKEAKVAQWIFETFVSTESESATLKKLFEKGIKNKKGKDFNKSSLHKYLCNKKLIAQAERNLKNKNKDESLLLPYEKYKLVSLDYDPVIPIELWEKTQRIIRRNSEFLQKNTKLKKVYLLHGLLSLADKTTFCGTGANGNGGRKNYYFNKSSNLRIDAEEAELGASKAVIQIIKDSEKLLRSIRRHSTSESRNDLYKSELQRSKDILNGLEVEKKKAYGRLDLLIQNGSQEKVKQYVKDFEDSVDKIDKEISILKSKIESKAC